MRREIKNELVKYVLEAEAHELNHDYENECLNLDLKLDGRSDTDLAYIRGRRDTLNEMVGRLYKLAGLLS